MGIFDSLFNALDSVLGPSTRNESEESGDSTNDSSDREVRIEGRQSHPHTHADGSYGTDTYAAKVVYENSSPVHESDAGFGHISNDSDTPDHVK